MAMSMMTTLFCGEVSRTQMYLSDSMVTWVKVTNCGAIPRLVSCNKQQRPRHGSRVSRSVARVQARLSSEICLMRLPTERGVM
jgi:hypothetical protein